MTRFDVVKLLPTPVVDDAASQNENLYPPGPYGPAALFPPGPYGPAAAKPPVADGVIVHD